jgi:alanine racemase
MVPTFGSEAETIVMNDLQPGTSSLEFVRDVSKFAVAHGKVASLHLFIDTGMHRDGVNPDSAVEFIEAAKKYPGVKFVGACTHYAASPSNREFSYRQLALFNQTIYALNRAGHEFEYLHTANSGAIVNLPEAQFNLVRAGFALYGYPPDECVSELFKVQPVLRLESAVVNLRRVKKGEGVGYDFTFIATEDINVATVPIGYGDGYFKTLGNKAFCILGGKLRPVIGTVCMDELMVNCGDDEIHIGDEVVLIGDTDKETISAYTVASWQGTIPYEVTSNLSARVPRVYLHGKD